MGSQLKKAHRTHALAQPAGTVYPHYAAESLTSASAYGEAERLYAELRRRVPDASERAAMLRVPVEQDAAWGNGRQLPLPRACRKRLAGALAARASG